MDLEKKDLVQVPPGVHRGRVGAVEVSLVTIGRRVAAASRLPDAEEAVAEPLLSGSNKGELRKGELRSRYLPSPGKLQRGQGRGVGEGIGSGGL